MLDACGDRDAQHIVDKGEEQAVARSAEGLFRDAMNLSLEGTAAGKSRLAP